LSGSHGANHQTITTAAVSVEKWIASRGEQTKLDTIERHTDFMIHLSTPNSRMLKPSFGYHTTLLWLHIPGMSRAKLLYDMTSVNNLLPVLCKPSKHQIWKPVADWEKLLWSGLRSARHQKTFT
jgi:hypothetical protein